MSICQSCSGRATLFLCGICQSKLRDLLEHLPQWIAHLEEAALGQVRLGDGGGGRSTSRREPFKGDDEVLARCACGHVETKHDDYYVAADGNARSVEQGCTAIDREVITMTALEINEDGDEVEVVTAEEIEKPCHCREYRPVSNQAKMRTQLLAAGRINSRAADLLDVLHNSITTWLRHICDQRRVDWVTIIERIPGEPMGFIGPLERGHWRGEARAFIGPLLPGHFRRGAGRNHLDACHWLAWHVNAIACDEGAGECLAELEDHVTAIEKVINRPIPMRYLGECPTWNEQTRKVCGTELNCREGTIEITCSKCRQTHKTDRLQLLMMNDLERKKLTVAEILALNARLPEDERTPERTLRRWVRTGPNGEAPELKPNGYLRPCSCGHARVHHGKSGCVKCGSSCTRFDGREVINRHSENDETLHKYADVRRLRVARPKRAARVVKTA